MKNRIAIIDGLRSPIAKAYGKLKDVEADTLGAVIAKELVLRIGIDYKNYDEVIIGNVAQPAHASNISRVMAIRAGFPDTTPAYTVHRNCASGMESVSNAIAKINSNEGELYLAGGVESMSNIPILYGHKLRNLMLKLAQKKTTYDKLNTILDFRPAFLKPIIGLISGLTDPISGQIMGLTAETLANEFKISRSEQDQYALNSHLKAQKATEDGIFKSEIHPIITDKVQFYDDDGIRFNQTFEALNKLRPIFDKNAGTVTAGNSSQVSDAASMLAVCSETYAKEQGITPLGYIKDFAYVGLEAQRMGLGPIYATKKLFDKTKTSLNDIDLIELNEAFAAQVIANVKAFSSQSFANKYLDGKVIGEINEDILNINGGAIALGHPVGMSGSRIILHTLKQLQRKGLQTGLATLCVGGGQGAAFLLEAQ